MLEQSASRSARRRPWHGTARPTARSSTGSHHLRLSWSEQAVVRTGPSTFRVTVPITGPAPPADQVGALMDEVQALCCSAAPSAGSTTVRAVFGRAVPISSVRSYLAMYVTTATVDGEPDRDPGHVASVFRQVARVISR